MRRFLPLLLLAACASSPHRRAIRTVLDSQQEAWNRGDIEAFMVGYWNSEELVFKSGDTEQRGWQATLDRYLQTYDTREKMGILRFSNLRIGGQLKGHVTVTGGWHLTRASGDIGGRFELTFRKFPEGWRIVRDETFSEP